MIQLFLLLGMDLQTLVLEQGFCNEREGFLCQDKPYHLVDIQWMVDDVYHIVSSLFLQLYGGIVEQSAKFVEWS